MAQDRNPLRFPWQRDSAEMRRLIEVALGQQKADLVLLDGDVVNVYTAEVQERCSVAIKGRHIAYVGRDAAHTLGPQTEVIDARGKTLVPGFIDGHMHIFSPYDVPEFVRHALPTGLTTAITEILELVYPLGVSAIEPALANLRPHPMRIFATLPPVMGHEEGTYDQILADEAYAGFVGDERILGIGESYWAEILRGNGRVLDLFSRAHAARKTLEGHTAGARDRRLAAYLSTGQTSTHEPISTGEALEVLRGGAHVLLRQGAIRHDLDGAVSLKDSGISLRRLGVCSDSVEPSDLLAGQYMNAIVQRAIDLGFEPTTAVRMATLNVAEHFHLDYWLGGLAPGKLADLIVLPDLRRVEPEYVLVDGRVVAKEGRTVVEVRESQYPETFWHTTRIAPSFNAADFRIAAHGEGTCRVRAIEQVTGLVTAETFVDLAVRDGELVLPADRDLVKVAAIERCDGMAKRFVGLLAGDGLRRGAMGTTMTWDSTAMIIVGIDESDMALAANRLVEMQGGAVACAGGRVLAELATPIGGLVSILPLGEIVTTLDSIQKAAVDLGSVQPRQLLSLVTLTTAAIPHLRIDHNGYHFLKDGSLRSLTD